MDDKRKLSLILMDIYERRGDKARISPAWLATEAMAALDGDKRSPPLIYRAAHLQLRQLARGICRKKFEDDGKEAEQSDLFPNLQKRYPAAHVPDAEPEYVLLEHLTDKDVRFNVRRLRMEADSKLHHADALEAWWRNRVEIAA